MRWVTQLRSFGRNAWSGLRATPLASGVAAATIGLCLVLVGAFGLLVGNMERLLDSFGREIRVTAYLEADLPAERQAELVEQLLTKPAVEGVQLVSPDQALDRFRDSRFGRAALLEGLDENPLPASLEIALVPAQRNAAGLEALAGSVAGLPGIAELGYGHEWVEGYSKAVGLIRTVGIAIGGVLVLATLLIVANTIRLSVLARLDEIEILRLVGAGRVSVAVPFLLEGLVQGLAGGLLALGLLFVFFQLLLPVLGDGLELLLGYATPAFLGLPSALLLVSGGGLLGLLGSGAALLQSGEGR
jgi:cell division transport system permease protein